MLHTPLLVAAALAVPAPAEEPSTKPDRDRKLVCVKEPVTGSRFTKRVCKTAAQWKQEREDAREMLLDSTRVRGNPGGN